MKLNLTLSGFSFAAGKTEEFFLSKFHTRAALKRPARRLNKKSEAYSRS
jgi:hypothetical protein